MRGANTRVNTAQTTPLARWGGVGAVLLVAVLGIAIGRAMSAPAERASSAASGPAVARPSRQGAAIAAIDYLSSLRWDVLVDAARRRRVIARRATADALAGLDAELAASAEPLRAAVTRAPVVARTVVLGYRIDAYGASEAAVSVWGMALFGTGAYPPTTQWATSRVELVWVSGRWLVSAVRSRGGPSPDSPLRLLAAADRGFRTVRHVP